jgi:hypothetical protein
VGSCCGAQALTIRAASRGSQAQRCSPRRPCRPRGGPIRLDRSACSLRRAHHTVRARCWLCIIILSTTGPGGDLLAEPVNGAGKGAGVSAPSGSRVAFGWARVGPRGAPSYRPCCLGPQPDSAYIPARRARWPSHAIGGRRLLGPRPAGEFRPRDTGCVAGGRDRRLDSSWSGHRGRPGEGRLDWWPWGRLATR